MCFDVPKVVRSPGCDHGHDEESRNGQDIKIDILEAYVWTSERFRVISGFYRNTGGLPEPSPGLMGLSGKDQEVAHPPPNPSPNWTRGLGRGPSLPSFPSSPLPPLLLVGLGFPEGEREGGGRHAATLGCPFLLSTKAHEGPYGSRGVPVTSR